MIFPGADAAKENFIVGYIAKLEENCARSRMMPVYRSEECAPPLMRIGDWLAYRQYYATWAQPPKDRFDNRWKAEFQQLPVYKYPMDSSVQHQSHFAGGENGEEEDSGAAITPGFDSEQAEKLDDASQFPTMEFAKEETYLFGSAEDPDKSKGEDLDDITLFDQDDLAATT